MSEENVDAVTLYVRMRLREMLLTGIEGKELARRMRVSPAAISQVQKKTGVGPRTIEKWATVLGLKTSENLRRTAYSWYLESHPATDVLLSEPGVQAAIESIVSLGQTTREHLVTILHSYAHPRFLGRDHAFWYGQLLAEVKFDAELAATARADQKAEAREKREAHKRKKIAAKKHVEPKRGVA